MRCRLLPVCLLQNATDDEIATRIAAVKRTPDSWFVRNKGARFSLAGAQGKFSLSRVGDEWVWPNGAVPSTHILKPAGIYDADEVEHATMMLSKMVGIETPESDIQEFNGQQTYIVERFDRRIENGMPVLCRWRIWCRHWAYHHPRSTR